MALVEGLSRPRIDECLSEAFGRQVPVAITFRVERQWYSLHTRILQRTGEKLYLEYPKDAEGDVPLIGEGLPVGLSFKIKHHKYLFSAVVDSVGRFQLDGGSEVGVLCVAKPGKVQRVQRRAYHRAPVPRNRSVLATFWAGGLSAAPANDSEHALTWEGWLVDISAGGFQVRTAARGAPQMETDDVVGVRIDLGQEYEPVLADAQLRHVALGEGGVQLMGFQFIGLNETPEGRNTLWRIGQVVCEFQRLADRRQADTVA